MSEDIQNAIKAFADQVETLEKALSQIPLIQYGSISGYGWTYVPFSKLYASPPSVLAVQTPVSPSANNKKLTPPQITPPTITAPRISSPSLATLQVNTPSPPVSWGQRAKEIISIYCSETLGEIPVIGGYFCSAVDSTVGLLAYYAANAIQSIYYAFDAQALLQNIEQAVDYKASQDFNSAIQNIQRSLDQIANDINGAMSGVTGDINSAVGSVAGALQNFINFIYYYVNYAYGLEQSIGIPVAQVQDVSINGFSVYIPEGATVYWVALG